MIKFIVIVYSITVVLRTSVKVSTGATLLKGSSLTLKG